MTRSARMRACEWTPTAPGAPIGPWPCWTRSSRSGSSWPSSPPRPFGGWPRVAAATSIPIAADESVDQRQGREASARDRRLPPGHGEAVEGRRDRPGGGDRRRAADLPLELPGRTRWGSPRRRTPPRRSIAIAEDPGLAHGLATQELFGDTIASAQCEVRDGLLHLPDGPGLGVEIDEQALEAAPPLARGYRSRRWIRPTATPRWPRRWSRSWRAAAPAGRRWLPAPGPPRWPSPSGASRRSRWP